MTKKEERQAIYDKTNGKCGYCGDELKSGWHVDHMEPVERKLEWNKDKRMLVTNGEMHRPENDCFENKIASCPSCNIRKHSANVEQFRWALENTIKSLNRDTSAYKFAKKYGLVKETGNRVEFYFETQQAQP